MSQFRLAIMCILIGIFFYSVSVGFYYQVTQIDPTVTVEVKDKYLWQDGKGNKWHQLKVDIDGIEDYITVTVSGKVWERTDVDTSVTFRRDVNPWLFTEDTTFPRLTVEYKGELISLQQLFRYSKVSYNLMYYRLRSGQSAVEAIQPVRRPVRTKHLFQGRLRTMSEIAALTGVNYNTLAARLNAGIPVYLAAEPVSTTGRSKKEMVKVKRI